jgi:putative peptide zinc metalloprotease protein
MPRPSTAPAKSGAGARPAPTTAGAPDAAPRPGLRASEEDFPLAPLRDDLRLHPGPSLPNGAPSWVIEDPVRARYFRIGWLEFELLSRWEAGSALALIQQVSSETTLSPTMEEVAELRRFLLNSELTPNAQAIEASARGSGHRHGLGMRLLHNYLMFRIPLWRPDTFLEAMLPLARPFLSTAAFWLSMLAGVAGLGLAALQWDQFAATFLDTLTPAGLLSYAVALAFAKMLHELGHAFAAKARGLRVAQMGVAIVLLFPMLYTDTGESWRLARHRERFAIAAAGMRAEFMLAAWSTLAWSFMPDGPLRSAMFFLATVSWLITLAINASPFLRFDGYYMLSDATGLPNLHDTAFANLRRHLRRLALGVDEGPVMVGGEPAPGWTAWFGLVTAVYRAVVFFGIALAVYHFFFKLAGIILFLVEIWWFLLRPFNTEMRAWWKLRRQARVVPALRLLLGLVVLVAVLAVPWRGQLSAEGWVRAAQDHALYAPRSAALDSRLSEGGTVQSGQQVLTLSATDLALRDARATARIESLDSRLQALAAQTDPASAVESARSARSQRRQQTAEVQAADEEARQLELTAPFAGRLVDVERDAIRGTVVPRSAPLARVVDTSSWVAEVFVDEEQVRRVQVGSTVRAYLHGIDAEVMSGAVAEVDPVPVERLPHEMLAVQHGGRLVTTDDGSLQPRRPLYRVRVALQGAPLTSQARLASFAIRAQPVSMLDVLWRSVASAMLLQGSF